MNKRTILMLLLLAVGNIALAVAPEKTDRDAQDQQTTEEFRNAMKSVDAVKRLPVTGLSLIKAGEQLFLITDNGHFIIAGNMRLVDMWQGKVIKSVDDTKDVDKVNLRKIGLSPDEIAAFKIGSGEREVTLFVDPKCQYCHALLSQLEPLGKAYTFRIVLVPVLGVDSANTVKKLVCLQDKAAALNALVAQDFEKLPAPPKDCDLKVLQKAVVATKLLDIQGVPYIFLPSHATHRGGTKALKELLAKDLEKENG